MSEKPRGFRALVTFVPPHRANCVKNMQPKLLVAGTMSPVLWRICMYFARTRLPDCTILIMRKLLLLSGDGAKPQPPKFLHNKHIIDFDDCSPP